MDAVASMSTGASTQNVVDAVVETAHRWLAKTYVEMYRELVKKVVDLESRLAKEHEKKKNAEHKQKVVHEYHVVLLKKYRLLVPPEEFKFHVNGYDRNLKFELSEPKVSKKDQKKINVQNEDVLLENLKSRIYQSPERNQVRVQDIDPQYKKRVEESYRRLQEKVGLKQMPTKKQATAGKDNENKTLILDDSKDLIPVKKSNLNSQGREYGFSADISKIDDYNSPGRKPKKVHIYS